MKNTKRPIITPKKISGQIRFRGVIRVTLDNFSPNGTEIGGGRVDGLVEIVGNSTTITQSWILDIQDYCKF